MPKLFIISGPNGSGKTTASYSLLPEMLECSQFVNSDEFAKGLSPFDPSAAAVSASRYMLMKFHYLMEKRQDFCIETTLATRSLLKLIQQAHEAGYHVTVLYFWVNKPEISIERVARRVATGGHDIPKDVIVRRYYNGLVYFFRDYAPLCDRFILADNSQMPFTVVADGTKKDVFIRDSEKYEHIRLMAQRAEERMQK